ncbi:hypothetical protein H9P43_004710 [Blastocladiella emersonii ATCC 22665]|nr:hypothetical protein H9P43_004710 [Blastocladiella emersonii ATCC 22665]
MTFAPPTVTLTSGRVAPALAYGTGTKWFKRSDSPAASALNAELVACIKAALHAGVRHIDTAEMYNTEPEVGAAVAEYLAENTDGVTRADLFITSKIQNGLVDVRGTIERALKACQVEYFDLYLIHSPFLDSVPNLTKSLREVWAELESARAAGLVRDIGVSNFRPADLDQLGSPLPAINQIEYHPQLPQPNLRAYLGARSIPIAAYGPLAPLLVSAAKDDALEKTDEGRAFLAAIDAAAQRTGVPRSTVLLAWSRQVGALVVSTSAKIERVREFLASAHVELTDDEVQAIAATGDKAGKLRKFWPAKHFDE